MSKTIANKKKKILFIENRQKTIFWSKVAIEIDREEGFETYFLVQSRIFKPRRNKNVTFIPFPSKEDIERSKSNLPNILLEYLKPRDRGYKYFNSGSDHYYYYYLKIKSFLEHIKPDLVVGESTLFHELITIFLCKKMNIPFVHPTGARYPSGRFQLFKDDTQNIAASSGESWDRIGLMSF